MRDPRAGSYGVVAVVLLVALKIAALGSLPPAARVARADRRAVPRALGHRPGDRHLRLRPAGGHGRDFKESIRLTHVVVAGAIALGAAGWLGGVVGVVAWTAGSLAVLFAGQWIAGRLGGLSGDIYGAICEITETGVLVLFGIQAVEPARMNDSRPGDRRDAAHGRRRRQRGADATGRAHEAGRQPRHARTAARPAGGDPADAAAGRSSGRPSWSSRPTTASRMTASAPTRSR